MKLEDLANSKTFKIIIGIIGGLIIALLIFKVGIIVGSKKAAFSCRWAEHYAPNFIRPRNDMMDRWIKIFNDEMFMKSHGAVGTIIKIDKESDSGEPSLIIKGEKEAEKVIIISPETIIEKWQEKINISDLKVGDYVVVIGDDNSEGQIEAKLIRVVPQPPTDQRLGGPRL